MEREDYLLRMIAQTALVLAHVRRLLLQGKTAEAGGELEQAAMKAGIDLPLLLALDNASLRPLLLTGGEFDRARCAFYAEVLYLEWRRLLVMNSTARAAWCAQRALLLFALAYEGIVIDDDARRRIAELQGELEPVAFE